jgi:hypothetical protein
LNETVGGYFCFVLNLMSSSSLPVTLLVATVMLLTVVSSKAQEGAGKDSLKAVLVMAIKKLLLTTPSAVIRSL